MRRLAILGATGSIGESTLDVVARHPGKYAVTALAAHGSVEKLARQCERFRPRYAALADAGAAERLAVALKAKGLETEVLGGPMSLEQVACAPETDAVMAAVVGAAGLPSTIAAARAGKDILLANKEALVVSGSLFLAALAQGGGRLLPIDSEHSAVFQSLPRGFTCGRAGEAERAGVLVDAEVAEFVRWQRARSIGPILKALQAQARGVVDGEMARLKGKLAGLTPEQQKAVETLVNGVAQKLLHRPMTALREAAAVDGGPDLAGAVQALFGVEVAAEAPAPVPVPGGAVEPTTGG